MAMGMAHNQCHVTQAGEGLVGLSGRNLSLGQVSFDVKEGRVSRLKCSENKFVER